MTGYIPGDGGVILKTTNGGVNWYRMNSPVGNSLLSVTFPDSSQGWICGMGTLLHYGGPVGVKKLETGVPEDFSLSQNYPNPFNPVTNFELRIKNFGFVTLKVFDARGKEVSTLLNENMKPGVYKIKFDGSDYSSGVYFYRMTAAPEDGQAGDFAETKKMMLIK